MRALVLEEYGEPLKETEVEALDPDSEGAVVDVEACGICRSDWHAWKGHGEWADDQVPIGQILGHEPAGRVAAVGERVDSLRPGDRVVVPFNLGDGTCHHCQNGQGNVCEDGFALGFEESVPGAFAEQFHVPRAEYNAIPLPDSVSARDAAALGCRYATAFHALAHRAELGAGDWVAVHGCGGLGLAAVEIAGALGANVVAVDIRAEPLEMATELGADETIQTEDETDVPQVIEDMTDGGAHVSMDALGRAETCRNSIACLRSRGCHVQVGLTTDAEKGEVPLPIDTMTRWDVSFVGSRGMPPSRYDELLRMIGTGNLDPGRLVTNEVSLEQVSDRLAAMTEYETTGVEIVTGF